jgi:hypothetical protein
MNKRVLVEKRSPLEMEEKKNRRDTKHHLAIKQDKIVDIPYLSA